MEQLLQLYAHNPLAAVLLFMVATGLLAVVFSGIYFAGDKLVRIIRSARGRNGNGRATPEVLNGYEQTNPRLFVSTGEPLPKRFPQAVPEPPAWDVEPGVVKFRLEALEKAVMDPETGLVVEVHSLKETCSEISQGVADLKKSQPIHVQQVVEAIRGVRESADREARKAVAEELVKRGIE